VWQAIGRFTHGFIHRFCELFRSRFANAMTGYRDVPSQEIQHGGNDRAPDRRELRNCKVTRSMPYLQLDTSRAFSCDEKAAFSSALADCYATHMQMDRRRISVAIRELGPAGLWRIVDDRPVPANLLMCDIRRGRAAAQRDALARALLVVCEARLGLPAERVNIEFTQHTADEMYHPTLGGFGPEWHPPDD